MGRKEYSSWFRWTEERLRFLYENFARNSNQSIADALGCDKQCVTNKAHSLRMRKDKAYSDMVHTETSKPYRYKKGHVIPEDVRKRRDTTRAELVRIERIRLKYGLSQRTKIKLTNIY